jgi:hypothetical protein
MIAQQAGPVEIEETSHSPPGTQNISSPADGTTHLGGRGFRHRQRRRGG